MDSSDLILEERFDSPELLLAALDPLNERWRPDPRPWIYRGHASSTWSLVPTAFRESVVLSANKPHHLGPFKTYKDQVRAEADLLLDFLQIVDRQGLEIPAASHAIWSDWTGILEREIEGAISGSSIWPPRRFQALLALAQHHGVPTRLLDWTSDAFVAAYFAAVTAATWEVGLAACPDDANHLAIWCYNPLAAAGVFKGSKSQLRRVVAPRHSNPNLHAQAGLFTVVEHRSAKPEDPAIDPPVDELYTSTFNLRRQSGGMIAIRSEPAFRKLSIHTSHAPKLLRLLAFRQVDAARLIPSYVGAARALEERRLWDDAASATSQTRNGIG